MVSPSDPLIALADALIAEQLAPFRDRVPAVFAAIKRDLERQLLITEAGRQMLRSALPDPVVEDSGDRATPDASNGEVTPADADAEHAV